MRRQDDGSANEYSFADGFVAKFRLSLVFEAGRGWKNRIVGLVARSHWKAANTGCVATIQPRDAAHVMPSVKRRPDPHDPD